MFPKNPLPSPSAAPLLCVSLLIILPTLHANPLPLSDPNNTGQWKLLDSLSDEFNAPTLDLKKWHNLGLNDNYHGEWKGRAPSQYNPANITVANGHLTITSRWEPDFEFSPTEFNGVPYGKPAPVTTAAIVSQAKFKHGYLEMRCRAASGPVSSSFWTTGKGGEIDVFEHFGHNPKKPNSAYRYHTSFHDWRKGSPTFSQRIWENNHRLAFKVADDFHTYGLEWTDYDLRIYVDGRLINFATRKDLGDRWIANNEQKIWIDSELFPWEIASEKLTASDFNNSKFIVDYCRVWQRTSPRKNEKPTSNLFGNSSFEEGLKNWAGDGVIISDPHTGTSAATLTKAGKIQQTVNVKPNTTYILSAWAKLPATNMKDAWTDAYLNVAAYGAPRLALKYFKPTYTHQSLEFTTGPNATTATIFFTNQPKSHPATIDTFRLLPSTPAR